jgi:hypothetical protein
VVQDSTVLLRKGVIQVRGARVAKGFGVLFGVQETMSEGAWAEVLQDKQETSHI